MDDRKCKENCIEYCHFEYSRTMSVVLYYIYHIVSVVVCSETVYSKQTTIFGPMLVQKSIANVLKIEICPTSLK